MNEKLYKTLGQFGAAGIVVGIISILAGVSLGISSIVHGARALAAKKNIMI